MIAMLATGCGGDAGAGASVRGELLLADRGEDFVVAIGSDGASVYLGGMSQIVRIDKATKKHEVLAGWLRTPSTPPADLIEPATEHAENFATDGAYLYYDAWGYGIYRLPLGDGYSSVHRVITSTEMGLFNLIHAYAQNTTQAFWATSNGAYEVVYARRLSGGATTTVTTSSSEVRLAANDAVLYVCPPGGTISRYDVTTGQILLGIPTAGPSFGGALATALSASDFFWADSAGIHRIAHDGSTAVLVVPGLTGISQLTVDDTTLYALDSSQDVIIGPPPIDTVYAIDLATGTATPLFSAEFVTGILARGGTLYWTTGWDLHARAPDGTTAVLITDPTRTSPMGNVLHEVAGKIAAVSEDVVRTYDLSTGSTQEVYLASRVRGSAVVANTLFAAGDAGIFEVPFDAPLRIPERLRYGMALDGFALHQGWLYWSEYDFYDPQDPFGKSRIARMRTDGTSVEVLFDRIHRGMMIDGEQIYFACESSCGYPNWTLVSMPVGGGAVRAVAPLHMWPNNFATGEGHALVADTADSGATFTIYAIDLATGRSAELVKGLPFVGLELQAKDGWLYTVDYFRTANRYQIHGWASAGPPIPIDAEVVHAESGGFFTWRTGVGLTAWR